MPTRTATNGVTVRVFKGYGTRGERWGYELDFPWAEWPWSSKYLYHSAESAMAAGLADAEESRP